MFSTLKNVSFVLPRARKRGFVGQYLYYPDSTGQRTTHGGLRLQGKFKHSLPEMPLVTVVTVCRNAEKLLEQCILSVLHQSYENIEYIVVDGASTDGTLVVIDRYKDAIDYFLSEPDRCLYHAMNKGLELAKGEYVLFLNSDDWYEVKCVESLWVGLLASDADFSCALTTLIDKEGKAIRQLPRMPFNESSRFGMPIRHELMFVSAHIYNEVGGYNENYKIIADFDLAVRIYDKGYMLYEINRPLLNFRTTGVSSTDWQRLIAEHKKLYSAQYPEIALDDLELLSDPSAINAELIEKIVANNSKHQDFVLSLLSYGYRRGLFTSERPSSHILMVSPRVSVIVPVFNSAGTIQRCVNSVLKQNISDIEVICIDDGSTDESATTLCKLALNDSRVWVINNPENRGVAAARNIGVANARGEYCFFVDSDDEISPGALEKLLYIADRYRSDIVRGVMEKVREAGKRIILSGAPPDGTEIINTSVFETPALLATSEGFTTCLYRRSLVKNCRFISGMSMGEDSLFLIKAFLQALTISWLNEPVYRYYQHSDSAMNNFNLAKYLDAIEWRERAWVLLSQQGLTERANFFAFKYWNLQIFTEIRKRLSHVESDLVFRRLSSMLKVIGLECSSIQEDDAINVAVQEIQKVAQEGSVEKSPNEYDQRFPALSATRTRKMRVGVFNTFDRGGAATGSIRRIIALREAGVEATLHPLVSTTTYDFVIPLVQKPAQNLAWQKVHQNSILRAKSEPGFQAMELFSLPYSVVDYTKYTKLLSTFDVLHLHWVVGILDYQNAGEVLGDKPVVWTLADMNAFTGGCHYSEGCEEYQRECQRCPLLGGSSLAHEGWKVKKAAYSRIRKLEIICPSEWMAQRVSRSSLLGDRRVNVIPNALPVNSFMPVNRLVARIKLGLPLHKKLILFGSDSLANKRKGGDILKEALTCLAGIADMQDVEVLTYGNHTLDLPLPVHSLGFLNDHEQLSLAYSAANVYAFPSREDNAPLTVAESLMCGTPVVAFPVGNVPELVTHEKTGYLAAYLSTQDFCKGLEWGIRALDDAERIDIIRDCRQAAIRHHDPKLAVNRHLQVYLRVCKWDDDLNAVG